VRGVLRPLGLLVTAALLLLAGGSGLHLLGVRHHESARRAEAKAPHGADSATFQSAAEGSSRGSRRTTSRAANGAAPAVPAAQGTEAWRLTKPADHAQIEGYATASSGLPGTRVGLRVSTAAPTFRVQAYRVGWYRGGTGRLTWSSPALRGGRQAKPQFQSVRMRTVVAPWRTNVTVETSGWEPGAYVFKLVASSGWQSLIPYVVTSPSAVGKVALVAPVTTWQAYNDWGGYDLYTAPPGRKRSLAVSFDRPYPAPGANQMMFGVVPVVVLAERLHLPLAYFTNVDLDRDPAALTGARAYVSLGHDEYWTAGMRSEVQRALGSGTNLAFLGANTMYWQIRLGPSATGPRRMIVGYKVDAGSDPVGRRDPQLSTGRFRDLPKPEPEAQLTGLQYECFPVDAPYRVVSPHWWGFAGTGVRYGAQFGHLVGVEADRAYPRRFTPQTLEVLSDVRFSCLGVETDANSAYYTAPSGAGVFATGTLRWTCALDGHCSPCWLPARTVRFVRHVTSTVLTAFATGPAGRQHPAHPNLERWHLSPRNFVPAS
jgi:hypothetical protein